MAIATGRVLMVAAVAEIATGLALLVAPALVGQLLLGTELVGAAALVAHVAGIALVALGIACWPGTPVAGMLVYGAGVTVFLAYVGLKGFATGALLWPAVAAHAVLTGILLWTSTRKPKAA
jgi:hypothetical protein